jgi:hypothetical protein
MSERKKLSDILLNSERDKLARSWDTTQAAAELKPLPSGEYRCMVASGELFSAKKGTPGYKLRLVVLEGEYIDRVVWHDLWLSEAALPMTKRDLAKLGVTDLEQLDRPLLEGIVVKAKVALRKNDDGMEYNRVSRFDVVDFEPPEPDPFAPTDDKPIEPDQRDSGGFDWTKGEQKDPPAPRRGRGAYGK